jgi:hypothetical protein
MALSSCTGADRERHQRIEYDAFAELTMKERHLRVCDVRDDISNRRKRWVHVVTADKTTDCNMALGLDGKETSWR